MVDHALGVPSAIAGVHAGSVCRRGSDCRRSACSFGLFCALRNAGPGNSCARAAAEASRGDRPLPLRSQPHVRWSSGCDFRTGIALRQRAPVDLWCFGLVGVFPVRVVVRRAEAAGHLRRRIFTILSECSAMDPARQSVARINSRRHMIAQHRCANIFLRLANRSRGAPSSFADAL